MSTSPRFRSRGVIVLFALVVGAVVMAITVGFFNYFASAVGAERFALASAQALALAEAGVDKAVYELNRDAGYSGESDTALGNGTFSVSVSTVDGATKRLTATGSVPNSVRPVAVKVVEATASTNSSVVSFRYGVQIGAGGVMMNNGSRIEGNLFSLGDISGSGTITGDAIVAVGADTSADQQWTIQNSGFSVGDTAAHANVAQSFRPSMSASLAGLQLNLKKTGNPGDLIIKIVADNNGKPSSTALASGTLAASLVTAAYGFIDVTLDGTPALTEGATYWVIAVAPVSASNYFIWGRDSSAGYSRGSAKYSNDWSAQNPSWTSISGDLDFKMYVSGVSTSLSGITVGGNAWAHSLSNCSVGGDASYQTISNCTVSGVAHPGAADAAPVPFPISDAQIADWEAAAASGGTTPGPYTLSGTVALGPTKVDGDLTVTNGSALILSGPVWVNGNASFSNNAAIRVSTSTGAAGAVLIADATNATSTSGKITIANNAVIEGNGDPNSFPMLASTNTGNNAIELSNNASGVILYAPAGGVEVSNGTSANQVTARRLELENNAVVTYMSGLQNAAFSNGPGGSWTVVPGTYVIMR